MKRQKNTDLALTGSRGRLYRRCVQKAGKNDAQPGADQQDHPKGPENF